MPSVDVWFSLDFLKVRTSIKRRLGASLGLVWRILLSFPTENNFGILSHGKKELISYHQIGLGLRVELFWPFLFDSLAAELSDLK